MCEALSEQTTVIIISKVVSYFHFEILMRLLVEFWKQNNRHALPLGYEEAHLN